MTQDDRNAKPFQKGDPENETEQMKPSDQSSQGNLLHQNERDNQESQQPDSKELPLWLAALSALMVGLAFPLGMLGLLVSRGFSFQQHFLLLTNQLALLLWLILGAIAAIGTVLCWFFCMLRWLWRTPLDWIERSFLVCFVGFLCCVSVLLFTDEVDVTSRGFMPSALSISAGNSVTFVNPADGVTQVLCIGSHEECHSKPARSGDPPQLDHGLRLLPGQSVSVAFPSDGVYSITSQTTPNMNITIRVNSSSDDGG